MLEKYKIAESYQILQLLQKFNWNLGRLNGLLFAMNTNELINENELIWTLEIKNSFEMSEKPIAALRLFELLSAEKKDNNKLILFINSCIKNFKPQDKIDLHHLLPFPYNEQNEKSNTIIHTKRILQTHLEQIQDNTVILDAILLWFYITHFKPFKVGNHYIASLLANRILIQYQYLPIPILLLNSCIKDNSTFHNLLQEGFKTGNLQPACLYLLPILNESLNATVSLLSKINIMKQNTLEQLQKYTEVHFPSDAINKLLYSQPFIKVQNITSTTSCHRQTAYKYLLHLQKMGILIEKKVGREKLFFQKRYFDQITQHIV